jgi:hypothetical protein
MILVKNSTVIKHFKQALRTRFNITDMGELTDYLGIEHVRDRQRGIMKLSQTTYLKGVLKRYGFDQAKPNKTLFNNSIKLHIDEDDFLDDSEKERYQSGVGSLTYGMQGTRPDIAFVISLLSRFLSKPTLKHRQALNGVIRYIQGTLETGIVYNRHEGMKLCAYTDADYARKTLTGDGKSTSGYIFFMCGGLISWSSKRQPMVTLSSIESEYVGLANAIRHAVHLSQFLHGLRLPTPLPIPIYADNQSAIALSKNPEHHARSKHIDVVYHFQREKIQIGLVEIIYIATEDMAADGLTKPTGCLDTPPFWTAKRDSYPGRSINHL